MPMIRRTSRYTAGPEVTLTYPDPVRKTRKTTSAMRHQARREWREYRKNKHPLIKQLNWEGR